MPRRPAPLRHPTVGGRAVVGGLVVAAAMVTAFALATRSPASAGHPVVVARADVAPGAVLDAGAVRVEHLDLPAASLARTFASPDEVAGAVALGPVAADEVVQRAAVLAAGPGGPEQAVEYSLAVDGSRALGGDLVAGDVVDVLATYGTGEAATTAVVAGRARVVGVAEGGATFAPGGAATVTLAVPSRADAVRLAHAADAGTVSLARATRAGGDQARPDPYRLDAGGGGPGRPP